MDANGYWQLFLQTGAPEAYLLYARQLRMEETHVLDHPGDRAAGNGLQ